MTIEFSGPRVFSGTAAHFSAMASGHPPWTESQSYWKVDLIGRMPLGLPFSFVADILLLPYTIPAQIVWGDFEKPLKDKNKKEKP